jgi:hypothetical protein
MAAPFRNKEREDREIGRGERKIAVFRRLKAHVLVKAHPPFLTNFNYFGIKVKFHCSLEGPP